MAPHQKMRLAPAMLTRYPNSLNYGGELLPTDGSCNPMPVTNLEPREMENELVSRFQCWGGRNE